MRLSRAEWVRGSDNDGGKSSGPPVHFQIVFDCYFDDSIGIYGTQRMRLGDGNRFGYSIDRPTGREEQNSGEAKPLHRIEQADGPDEVVTNVGRRVEIRGSRHCRTEQVEDCISP